VFADMSLASLTQLPVTHRASITSVHQQSLLDEARKGRSVEHMGAGESGDKLSAANAKKKKRRKHLITANLSGTRYEVGESVCDVGT
jgi:hypothetical protein